MRWSLTLSLFLAAAMTLHAEPFVYVSKAPEQQIQAYRLDPHDGKLTPVATLAVKGTPGALGVDPRDVMSLEHVQNLVLNQRYSLHQRAGFIGLARSLHRPVEVVEHRIEALFVGNIGVDDEIAVEAFGERLHALAERLALIGESQPGARSVQRLGDAPGERAIIGDAHDEPLLPGHCACMEDQERIGGACQVMPHLWIRLSGTGFLRPDPVGDD